MEVWTDGEQIVHAGSERVRVIRDGEVVCEGGPFQPGYDTPLAVQPHDDRVWVGSPLRELYLTDVSEIAVHDVGVRRVAALADGRLVAVLGAHRTEPCELVVGRPGDWDRRVVLDESLVVDPLEGFASIDEEPHGRSISRKPTLTANEHGIVVADGTAGVVALFTDDLDIRRVWHGPGAAEAELIGYATDDLGVLTTARWAGRETYVGWLTNRGSDVMFDAYGAIAIPAGSYKFWVVTWNTMELRDEDGVLVSARPLDGFIQGACACETTCVAAAEDRVTVGRNDGTGLATQTVHFSARRTVVGYFDVPAGMDSDDETQWMFEVRRRATRQLSGLRDPPELQVKAPYGKPLTITVAAPASLADDLAARLRGAGASRTEVDPHPYAAGQSHESVEGKE